MSELVLDLETEKEFREVGGRDNIHLLGVTVVGIYDYDSDRFSTFEQSEFSSLIDLFHNTSRLIGFNIRSFDIPALEPYLSFDLKRVPTLDLMDDVEKGAGFRISLDNLCSATLGVGKSGLGLDAIKWWREGNKDKVKEYCLHDVRLTRDLYEFGKKNGHVFFSSRATGAKASLPVSWGTSNPTKNILSILKEGFKKRQSVEIEYLTKFAEGNAKNVRRVDIYAITGDNFEGFCHLRGGKRIFNIGRVLKAELTKQTYKLEKDVQQNLI